MLSHNEIYALLRNMWGIYWDAAPEDRPQIKIKIIEVSDLIIWQNKQLTNLRNSLLLFVNSRKISNQIQPNKIGGSHGSV